ncbi:IS982 family transposase [Photorhabdus noenieputensis]|uniref:IS982-like element ISPlu11 family transposase n=1 Tax=Photorhabdus noenieputensis TaxID=1208607 RepID=UPI001BD27B0B|nr:IS982-like element ISPlu11 family transposase [Photorhabdus noenieputensis]MBS9437203.1 IS982 family transposase [Photorhabdus noenieputensis]MCK3670528.1 IS982 family transposase [Photorhabdus noenieputensis]
MNKLVEIFCDVDDFCRFFIPQWELFCFEKGYRQRHRQGHMYPSEIMTILILFHMAHYRDFKHFYLEHIWKYHHKDFPTLLSYTRFVSVAPSVLVPLCSYLTQLKGKPTKIAFIDSTSLCVCHNIRIPRHKVFKGIAQRGKTSMGWFYGFKLHLVVNHLGEILALKVTPGNVNDREPVRELSKSLTGYLYGDKGYLSQELADDLAKIGVTFITKKRRNMKAQALSEWNNLMLKKRFIIETINGQLKTISQIEHSRHRSIKGFLLCVLGGLIAYSLKLKKPSLKIFYSEKDISMTA